MQDLSVHKYRGGETSRATILPAPLRFCALALLLWGLGNFGLKFVKAQSCPTIRVSQKYTIAYGTVSIGGSDAPVGTVVEARSSRGDIVGCRVIDAAGALRTTKIYGEETVAGVTVPGLRTGETVHFYLNGVLAESNPLLQWVDDWMVGGHHQVTLFAQSAPTFTPTATATVIPPTATFTMTPTSIPTVTATNTPIPPTPTLTATATKTPTSTPTFTPQAYTPTFTTTPAPTATATPTPTPTNTRSASPDLSLSRKAANRSTVDYFQPVDYTITLHNAGALAQVQITDTLPVLLGYLPETLSSTAGHATYSAAHGAIFWSGVVEPGATVTITFGMSGPTPILPHDTHIENHVFIDDGVHAPFVRAVTLIANPWPTPTVTHTPLSTPTKTDTPTFTPTVQATRTATNTPPATPTNTSVPTFTPSLTPTNTSAPTFTSTVFPTHSPTGTPHITPTPTNTPSLTSTPTAPRVAATLQAGTGGTLSYTSTTGQQLTVQVPANAVTETLVLLLQPVMPQSTPADFAFAGQGFSLDVAVGDTIIAQYQFRKPITVTIDYAETATGETPEARLYLFFFDEEQQTWFDAATTCMPPSPYYRNLVEHRLTISICHLTDFALFRQVKYWLYLPSIQAKHN